MQAMETGISSTTVLPLEYSSNALLISFLHDFTPVLFRLERNMPMNHQPGSTITGRAALHRRSFSDVTRALINGVKLRDLLPLLHQKSTTGDDSEIEPSCHIFHETSQPMRAVTRKRQKGKKVK